MPGNGARNTVRIDRQNLHELTRGEGRVAQPPAKTGRKPALVKMRATVSR